MVACIAPKKDRYLVFDAILNHKGACTKDKIQEYVLKHTGEKMLPNSVGRALLDLISEKKIDSENGFKIPGTEQYDKVFFAL